MANLVTRAPLPAGFPPEKISEQLPRPSNQAASKSTDKGHKYTLSFNLDNVKTYTDTKYLIINYFQVCLTFSSPDLTLETFFFLLPARKKVFLGLCLLLMSSKKKWSKVNFS